MVDLCIPSLFHCTERYPRPEHHRLQVTFDPFGYELEMVLLIASPAAASCPVLHDSVSVLGLNIDGTRSEIAKVIYLNSVKARTREMA